MLWMLKISQWLKRFKSIVDIYPNIEPILDPSLMNAYSMQAGYIHNDTRDTIGVSFLQIVLLRGGKDSSFKLPHQFVSLLRQTECKNGVW
jgi:hypothetical protein